MMVRLDQAFERCRAELAFRVLRLLVAVQLDEQTIKDTQEAVGDIALHSRKRITTRANEIDVLERVKALQICIHTAAHELLYGFELTTSDVVSENIYNATENGLTRRSQVDINGILLLLAYNNCLKQAVRNSSIDFSILQVVLRWMKHMSEHSPDLQTAVFLHIQALEEVISLKTGLGLMELWTSLASKHTEPHTEIIGADLESLTWEMSSGGMLFCQSENVKMG